MKRYETRGDGRENDPRPADHCAQPSEGDPRLGTISHGLVSATFNA